MQRLLQFLVRIFLRYMPDAYVVAVVLTLLTFGLAITVAGYGPKETIESWGDSFWNLLAFTNQITLTLLLGYAFANTPPVRAALNRCAGLVRTPAAAYVVACLITGVCALLSWGLSLIAAGITCRALGASCRRRGVQVHYPLLVASAFSGFVIWHQGLSASIALTLATPGHFLEDSLGLIPIGETVFTAWNGVLILVVLATLPFVMAALRPRKASDIEPISEALAEEGDLTDSLASNPAETPAQHVERSIALNAVMVLCGLAFIWIHFIEREGGLTLNIFNFCFLVGGMVLAGSPLRYVEIIVSGGRIAAPFLLQYPFYSGIAGVMADSGLAQQLVDAFAAISTDATLPFFAFLSGGLLNLFVPSGGGQWAVQGPIMMSAAAEVGASLPRVAMGVALGDQWTNLIQPLAIIPVITIAGIPLRKVMGYTLVGLFWSGLLFSLALLFF